MKKISLIFFAAVSIILTGCGGGSTDKSNTAAIPEAPKANENHFTAADLVDLDLSADGIPVMITVFPPAKTP